MDKEIKQIQNELKKLSEEIKTLKEEMIKVEHLEEYSQASNFPTLIAIILLQLFTIFMLGWLMYKEGVFF